jgi:hypothetical protein
MNQAKTNPTQTFMKDSLTSFLKAESSVLLQTISETPIRQPAPSPDQEGSRHLLSRFISNSLNLGCSCVDSFSPAVCYKDLAEVYFDFFHELSSSVTLQLAVGRVTLFL